MYRHVVFALLAVLCIAQVLSDVSPADCPRELQRLQRQNAELAARLRNATDYIEEFTREFNTFFNDMTATRRPAQVATATRAPATARRP